jgi:ubiquinol-cytochrome c reductase cytochrome b subunit
VITNLCSAIPYLGVDIVIWLWGGFSVRNATLVRFYAFHFLFPMLIAVLSLIHLLYLHEKGSSNPLGVKSECDIIKFHPYFSVKDSVGFFTIWLLLGLIVLFGPNLLIDPENFINANPLVTPTHIQPEWYFLPIYAILRSIPSKLGGVVALAIRICILYFLPFFLKPSVRSRRFNVYLQIIF